MLRRTGDFGITTAALLAATSIAASAGAQTTNFSQDFSTSIDRGLAWFDNNGTWSNPGSAGDAAGLAALALLEKRESADLSASPQGYENASAADQVRLDEVFSFIIPHATRPQVCSSPLGHGGGDGGGGDGEGGGGDGGGCPGSGCPNCGDGDVDEGE